MSDTAACTIGWISAIEIEAAAALLFLDERHEAPRWTSPRDENDYTLGRIGSHNVVMASLPKGGNGTSVAATVARDMVFSFPNVRFCLMVGVGGGAPSERHDIRLGDIVVSTPTFYRGMGNENHGGVIEYNYGRTVEQGRFQSVRYLSQPPRLLLAAVQGLSMRYKIDGHKIHATVEKMIQERPRLWKEYRRPLGDTDRLYSSDGTPQERIERTQEEDNPMVHYGLIASADHFMENAQIRDLLAHQLDVLCFEMEAAGLMNNFPCLVIRGV